MMKCIATALTFCLLVLAAQAETFTDDFEDGDLDGWEVVNTKGGASEWKAEDGVLQCTRSDIWITNLVFGQEEWRNYTIEFDARMVERLHHNWYGIGIDLRLTGELNLVWCAVGDSAKWAFIEVWHDGNAPVKHLDRGFDLELDRWYHLKGVANEDNFEFYIDDELIVSLSDASLPSGRIGLSAGGCVAQFDNVTIVTGEEAPGQTTLAVSSSDRFALTWADIKSNL